MTNSLKDMRKLQERERSALLHLERLEKQLTYMRPGLERERAKKALKSAAVQLHNATMRLDNALLMEA